MPGSSAPVWILTCLVWLTVVLKARRGRTYEWANNPLPLRFLYDKRVEDEDGAQGGNSFCLKDQPVLLTHLKEHHLHAIHGYFTGGPVSSTLSDHIRIPILVCPFCFSYLFYFGPGNKRC
jgi:hypothetical protein